MVATTTTGMKKNTNFKKEDWRQRKKKEIITKYITEGNLRQ